jgi:hypothetical protein
MSKALDRLEYLDFEKAGQPRDGQVVTDRWWVVHPERGLAFYRVARDYRAPQCNHDRRLVNSLIADLYPGHEARHVAVVFMGPDGEAMR